MDHTEKLELTRPMPPIEQVNYRLLRVGETTQEGDECYWHQKGWTKAEVNNVVLSDVNCPYRRKITLTTNIEQTARKLADALWPKPRPSNSDVRNDRIAIITRHLTTLTKPLEDENVKLRFKIGVEIARTQLLEDENNRLQKSLEGADELNLANQQLAEENKRLSGALEKFKASTDDLSGENQSLRIALANQRGENKATLAKGVDPRNPLRTCSHGMLADQCGICRMPVKDDFAKESSE